jgi:site-specific recombinase XerD
MPTDNCLTNFERLDWLADGPFNNIVAQYIDVLRSQRYSEHTVRAYLGCLAHFSYWIKTDAIKMSSLDASLIQRFLRQHIPVCTCPSPCYPSGASSGAALRHVLNLLLGKQSASPAVDPVAVELERFGDYLTNTCGLAPATRCSREQHVGPFLVWAFGIKAPMISQLSATQLDTFFEEMSTRLCPASLRVACNSLRSYFRYRALLGEPTAALAAALPRIADWRRATLPKVLSDTELDAFLKAFDCADPVGLRDYAIARCLLDLALRGHEVADLTLESVDWRNATLTIGGTKSKRVQQLPLPVSTGKAIAQYLRNGRPQTVNRALFVRHRAPFDKPLSVPAIRNSMSRAFVRCGLRNRFCSTHVLRRTTATRLQRSGASVKEIADLLRHQSLDTASAYARVDLECLRAVALPWPGSRP